MASIEFIYKSRNREYGFCYIQYDTSRLYGAQFHVTTGNRGVVVVKAYETLLEAEGAVKRIEDTWRCHPDVDCCCVEKTKRETTRWSAECYQFQILHGPLAITPESYN